MGKIVVFKKPNVIRCHSCNKIKPEIHEEFSHRGIDYSDENQPQSWVVYQSGWKRVEVLPLKNGQNNSEDRVDKVYFHCPDCRSLG